VKGPHEKKYILGGKVERIILKRNNTLEVVRI
jgi:hypothetical protein